MASPVVVVRRTGGIAGQVLEGSLGLDSDDPRAPEARDLVGRIDPADHAVPEPPLPDMYVYTVELPAGAFLVPEHRLVGDVRRLVEVVLGSL